MQPPILDRYDECRSCPHGKLCYDWKQGMPNAITVNTGINCPVDGKEILKAIGLKKEENHA